MMNEHRKQVAHSQLKRKAGGIARHFDSHEELGAFLKDEVLKQHKDAVILVKGSHAMRMDLITDKLIALSESKDSIK